LHRRRRVGKQLLKLDEQLLKQLLELDEQFRLDPEQQCDSELDLSDRLYQPAASLSVELRAHFALAVNCH
jgi:hypothetical protein